MKFFIFSCFVALTLLTLTIPSTKAAPVNCDPNDDDDKTTKTEEIEKDAVVTAVEADATLNSEKVAATTIEPLITSTHVTDVDRFFDRLQSTISKAKPWVHEIEKETKRLEETAKRIGGDVVARFGNFVDAIIGDNQNNISSTRNTVATLFQRIANIGRVGISHVINLDNTSENSHSAATESIEKDDDDDDGSSTTTTTTTTTAKTTTKTTAAAGDKQSTAVVSDELLETIENEIIPNVVD